MATTKFVNNKWVLELPRFKSPNRRITRPLRNADRTAKSGLALTYRCTISAIIAVGPGKHSDGHVERKRKIATALGTADTGYGLNN